MKVVAIVPAAGMGARMNHRVPKQYLPLGGRPIVARTIMTLQSFPVIDEIVGRTDDIIVTPEGRRVGRLDPIFKGGLGIKEAQIIQTSKDEILIRIVKSESYSSKDLEFLSDQLRKRIGLSMNIRFEIVPQIERDRNGKFRSVVSLVGSRSR